MADADIHNDFNDSWKWACDLKRYGFAKSVAPNLG